MTLQKVLHFTGHNIARDLDKNLLDYYPFSVIPLSFYCDKGNIFLCKGGCFMGVLRIFHKYFEGASRCFQKDSNISALCFKCVLGCFCQKSFTFCVHMSFQLPMQTQSDRNTLSTRLTQPSRTQESHCNTLEIILKYL